MGARLVCITVCFLSCLNLNHAQRIAAVVADRSTHQPIGDVFVFLANSSAGTASDDLGRFQLELPESKDIVLVFSHINYELFTLEIADIRYVRDTFFLKSTGVELEEAVVTVQKKPRLRNRRLRAFTKAFLGENTNDKLVRIVNPDALLFQQKDDRLVATASEPLVIENRKLGYMIRFYLEAFALYDNYDLLYRGNTFFEPISASADEERQFEKNRLETFKESSRHFFSSLARHQLDSTLYRIGFSQMDHHFEFINFTPIQPSGIIAAGQEGDNYEIRLNGFLTVVHLNTPSATSPQPSSPPDLKQGVPQNIPAAQPEFAVSYLRSKSNKIIITKFGKIINPSDIEEYGYWTTQRVAALLPSDYFPEE